MISNIQARGQKTEVTAITTNTTSAAVEVGAWDYCIVTADVTFTTSCVFKFQVAYERGGTKYDLEVGGTIAVTETATGNYSYELELGAAEELYITSTDIGSSTLACKVFPFNRGV